MSHIQSPTHVDINVHKAKKKLVTSTTDAEILCIYVAQKHKEHMRAHFHRWW